jgi:coenzyme F420-dependent glucose-6-phosphate dehydrogenase
MVLPIEFGLTLSSEEHPPTRLVEMTTMAEEAGFDFVSISDHYHPWIDAQGHSPFVWSVLGAISQVTDEIDVCVGVTCPTTRIHPAIVAQATATTANLLPDRFIWGVGTGEALNEHILADRWPPAEIRLEKLEEAVELIRELWKGESVSHRGTYFTVEDARIYDPPPGPIPVIVSAFGPKAASVAARIGDGLWITGTDDQIVDQFKSEGGSGPVFSQLSLCHASSKEKAVETAFTIWPNTGVPGQLSQDLPTPAHFQQASQNVSPEMMAESIPCGPDAAPILESVGQAIEAGVDHVYFHQIGPDQEGFIELWVKELEPELASHRGSG